MVARDRTTILAAEPDRAAGKSLVKCLELLGYEPRLATTEKELLGLLRRELFRGAVVAAELGESGGGLLRLSRLPAMECLVVVGPPGDHAAEASARRAGAVTYLARPVTASALANALSVLAGRRHRGRRPVWIGP